MRIPRLALVAMLIAGCEAEPAPPVSPSGAPAASPAAQALPSASVRPSATPTPRRDPKQAPTRQDVTGRYHQVTEQQTTAGPTYECYADQFFMTWELDQRGTDVGGKLVYHDVADKPASPEYRSEFVYGTNVNGNVVLEGEYQLTDPTGKPLSETFYPVKYDLRFVESTGHLVGRRNDQPFYLRPILPGTEEKCQ